MREILFRGKRADTGEWIYGDLRQDADLESAYIGGWDYFTADCALQREPFEYPVSPETVGQFTGLMDKNGKKVFEGDICWFYGGDYFSGFWEQNVIVAITDITDDEQIHYLNNAEYCEVIGNIFDNPELLEGRLWRKERYCEQSDII